jgi:CubicO group peptidase (beta-lactamase class C family)
MATRVSLPDGLDRSLRLRVLGRQAEWRCPSVMARVVRGGEPVWTGGAGLADVTSEAPPDAGTQYRIGSITKSFTAVLVMQLRDEGKLALDDPLGAYLPGTRHGALTLRRMLSHVSGLQREPVGDMWECATGPDREALLAGLEHAEAVLPPGSRWHYSNLAYILLGEVVAKLCGASWEQVLAERILRPLGLRRTTVRPLAPHAAGYLVDAHADRVRAEPEFAGHAFAPAGELWSTAEDLGRWAAFLAEPPPEVLAPDTLDEMTFPQVMHDLDAWTLAWGLGLMLHRRGDRILVGHDGAMPGFMAGLAVRRAERVGAIVFANTTAGADPGGLAIDLVLETVDRDPVLPEAWRPGPPVPPELEGLLGPWWSEGSEFVFSVRQGVLEARRAEQAPGKAPSRFAPLGPDLFRTVSGREQGELLRVVRSPDGTAEKLYWATYPFTRRQQAAGRPPGRLPSGSPVPPGTPVPPGLPGPLAGPPGRPGR